MARDQWDLFRPTGQPGNFVEADLRLQQDGSYTAKINYDGQLANSMGRWEHAGDKITFIENDGKSSVFFTRQPHSEALQLVKGIKGTDVVLTLKKQHE